MEWVRGKRPADGLFDDLLLQAERGQWRLCVSRMNLGEVYYTTAKDYSESAAHSLLGYLEEARIEVVSVSDEDIDAAARLKSKYKISYADAFAAGLAMQRNAPLVTGDLEFKKLELDGLLRLHWMGA